MFKPVNSKASFPLMEENILKLWKEKDIFNKSVENRKGGNRFTLYEGPPTANGNPGIHHVLARVFKDTIPRYKAMKGFYIPRQAGWDTHGLPVELEVEKKLGFSGKPDIEKYGIAKFNALCRESVFKYLDDWNSLTERIAYWVDLDNAYVTMNNDYIETIWWAIKQMWDKGLVYHGYRVTPHCPRCGTSLSSHEVALGYKDDAADPSVHIKFRITQESLTDLEKKLNISLSKPAYLVAWTTTPWTLPGNTALAVSPDSEYAVIENNDEYLILAYARLEPAGLGSNEVLSKLKGDELAGLSYEPLFNPHKYGIERMRFTMVQDAPGREHTELVKQETDISLVYRLIAADFVSMEDGTGIVHVAPAYGEIDYQAGEQNLLNFVHTVNLEGHITGSYPFSGKFVKRADTHILEELKSRGLLLRSETIHHTYPFCWRCDTPL
ncbi:class I tRNA ligase family protein, partial [Chloroflexota bacterium]